MFHLRSRLSNLFEHICFKSYQFCSNHMRFVIIEPDTTSATDIEVTNAGITLSNKMVNEICACGINTNDGNINIMFSCIKGSPWLYALEWSKEVGSVPLQYCQTYHTWGCQPWRPTPTQLLCWMELPISQTAVLPVKRIYEYSDSHYLYGFSAPSWHTDWFIPFRWLILRMAFRYADNRFS